MPTPPTTQRPPRRTQPPARPGAAALGGSAAGVTAGGATVAAAGAAPVAGIAAIGKLSQESIEAAFQTFFGTIKDRREHWVRQRYRGYAPQSDVAEAIALENELETEYRRKAEERVRRDLPKILALPPVERAKALQALTERERRYAAQRSHQMLVRAAAAVDRAGLRRESPRGVRWRLGQAATHTAECVFLNGRVIPWQVLDAARLWPPLHGGCRCGLEGIGRQTRVPAAADAARDLAPVLTGHIAERLARTFEAPDLVEAMLRVGLVPEERAQEVARKYVEEVSVARPS